MLNHIDGNLLVVFEHMEQRSEAVVTAKQNTKEQDYLNLQYKLAVVTAMTS